MLINIAEETLLQKDKPAILMSQNAAAVLPHLIISCSLATFEFFFSRNYALQLCQHVRMWKLRKETLHLSIHSDVEDKIMHYKPACFKDVCYHVGLAPAGQYTFSIRPRPTSEKVMPPEHYFKFLDSSPLVWSANFRRFFEVIAIYIQNFP